MSTFTQIFTKQTHIYTISTCTQTSTHTHTHTHSVNIQIFTPTNMYIHKICKNGSLPAKYHHIHKHSRTSHTQTFHIYTISSFSQIFARANTHIHRNNSRILPSPWQDRCVCNALQHTAATHCCNTLLQHTAATYCCNTMLHTAIQECLTIFPRSLKGSLCLQRTARHCWNTLLQHTAATQYYTLQYRNNSQLFPRSLEGSLCRQRTATHCYNTLP